MLYAKRKWSKTFKILQERKCEPRILDPAKLTFKYKGHRQPIINVKKLG